jgi:phosphatidylglycerophosphatase A
MNHLATFIATGAYSGFFPIAPGTVGSAVGLVVFAAVRAWTPWWGDAVAVILALALGVWSAGLVERRLQLPDPGPVVIDEILGMLLTLLFLPVTMTGAFVGFVVFRIFDVIKPFPANRAEKLPGGWGIMLDDAISGVYAHVALRLLALLIPGLLAA